MMIRVMVDKLKTAIKSSMKTAIVYLLTVLTVLTVSMTVNSAQVGPFDDYDNAEVARDKLRKHGVDDAIVRLPGELSVIPSNGGRASPEMRQELVESEGDEQGIVLPDLGNGKKETDDYLQGVARRGVAVVSGISSPGSVSRYASAAQSGGDASGQVVSDVREGMARAVIDEAVDQYEDSDYNPFKWIDINYTLPKDDRKTTFSLDTHYSFYEEVQRNFFWQVGVRRADIVGKVYDPDGLSEDGSGYLANTYNLGLGYRQLTEDEKYLLGVNLFYDYQSDPGHQRVSIGSELKSSAIDINGNWYKGLSDWKRSPLDGLREQRAMDGMDLAIAGRVPQFPQLELGIKGYKFCNYSA